ncbi:Protein of unknown function [Gryllus bimaculatus]|nr:Protein of unknown function [Gryllus bimaculatus]
MRDRRGRRSLGSACHGSLLPAVYKAALAHSANQRAHRPVADHSQDAILYVTVVIVFYAAIILLLVGTNLRRRSGRPRNAPPPPPQVLVYDQKRGTVQQKSVTPPRQGGVPSAARHVACRGLASAPARLPASRRLSRLPPPVPPARSPSSPRPRDHVCRVLCDWARQFALCHPPSRIGAHVRP